MKNISLVWKGSQLIRNLKSNMPEALYAGGSELKKDSNDIAPKDKSELINTSVLVIDTSKFSATVRYTQKYAKRLHDHPEYKFSKDKNPKAQGKFLLRPFEKNKHKYLKLMNSKLKEGFRI